MKHRSIHIQFQNRSVSCDVRVGSGLLAEAGQYLLRRLVPHTAKIALISNPTVFGLWGQKAVEALRSAGFAVSHFLMRDGERFKTLRTAEAAMTFLADAKMSRRDAVVTLGGGVVGDLGGFAAAVYMRGIPFVQVPTTLLAMVDASVGGKTGVNTRSGKNFVGAFHQPCGVLIDVDVLKTLPRREFSAGLFEAVKHAALAGRQPLERLSMVLSDRAFGMTAAEALADLIAENVRFKAAIVKNDERETPDGLGSDSRKILNLGHTFAHALEKVTDYKRFRHGEAVGHGILFAAEVSKSLALCGEKDVNLLYDVVHRVGPLPSLAGIHEGDILSAFSLDKKNNAGSIEMVLLKGIGKPVITNDIPIPTLKRVLRKFLQDRA